MKTKTKFILGLLLILLIVTIFWFYQRDSVKKSENDVVVRDEKMNTDGQIKPEFAFQNRGLKTNTAKLSIPLSKVLDGGPGKDGIPAINNPKFFSTKDALGKISEDIDGIVVVSGNAVKFYPYSILVWHEIVNDNVGGKPLTITFCPLCGSAIVFDSTIDGKIEQFGVSGKLYESNLLMYDRSTESLWSQSIGTAVVGDRTGEKLVVYPSQVMSFKAFRDKWPDGKVLSTDTGYSRNYKLDPYGDYNSNEKILFPISVKDNRFPSKEIMYVVSAYNHSVAIPLKELSESVATLDIGGKKITAVIIDGEIVVKDSMSKVLPGYHEMWFSWAIHHQDDGIVWKI